VIDCSIEVDDCSIRVTQSFLVVEVRGGMAPVFTVYESFNIMGCLDTLKVHQNKITRCQKSYTYNLNKYCSCKNTIHN